MHPCGNIMEGRITLAERRMLSKSVVETDRFRDLPLAAQALYLHLNMEADDDGFLCSARSTARSVGAGREELEALVSAGFLLCFDSGVVLIRHWLVSNALRPDRHRSTAFIDERAMVTLDRSGVYRLKTEEDRLAEAGTEGDDAENCPPSAALTEDKSASPADNGQPSAAFSAHWTDSCQPTDNQTPPTDSQTPPIDSQMQKADSQMPPTDSQMQKADSRFPSQVRLGEGRLGKVRSEEVKEKEREGKQSAPARTHGSFDMPSADGRADAGRRDAERSAPSLPFSPSFTPPTADEVAAYCRKQGADIDAERFCSFYASKGWRVGSQPMRDWRAAVRTWILRERSPQKNQPDAKPAVEIPGMMRL